jgi:hypothetical protein
MCHDFMPAGRLADWMKVDPWSFSSIGLHTFPNMKFQRDKLFFSQLLQKSLTPASDPLR